MIFLQKDFRESKMPTYAKRCFAPAEKSRGNGQFLGSFIKGLQNGLDGLHLGFFKTDLAALRTNPGRNRA